MFVSLEQHGVEQKNDSCLGNEIGREERKIMEYMDLEKHQSLGRKEAPHNFNSFCMGSI